MAFSNISTKIKACALSIIQLLLLSNGLIAQSRIITGQISFPTVDFVQVGYVTNYINYEEVFTYCKISEDGNFRVVIPDDYPTLVNLKYGNGELPIFLKLGDSIQIISNSKYLINGPKDFLGDRVNENKYLADKNTKLCYYDLNTLFGHATSSNVEEFEVFIDKIISIQESLLAKYSTLDADFKALEINEILAKRKYYSALKASEDGIMDNNWILDKGLNDQLITSKYYNYFLGFWDDSQEIIELNDYPRSLDYLNTRRASRLFTNHCRENTINDQIIATILNTIKDEQLKSIASKSLACVHELFTGKKMPDFALPNQKGLTINSQEWLGKPVIIEFWATYCQPCIKGIHQSQSIIEKYNDKVNFVFISMDENPKKWKDYVQSNQLKGYHLHFNNNQQIITDYGVLGLPHSVVLGKNGRISAIEVVENHSPYFEKMIERLIENP